MNALVQTFLSADFLKIALPAAVAIIAWFLNERSKVRSEQLQRKEERYKELLRCLKGFYVHVKNEQLKSEFVDQANLCWLYAPDEVIRKANHFLETISAARKPLATDDEKERSLGELVLAIRRDMLSRRRVAHTSLSYSDWKNFNVGTR